MKNDINAMLVALSTELGNTFTRPEAAEVLQRNGFGKWGALKEVLPSLLNVSRGQYAVPANVTPIREEVAVEPAPVAKAVVEAVAPVAPAVQSAIPAVNPNYVPFGVSKDLDNILKANIFAPVLITGDSGTGKTLAVLQAAAKAKRSVYPVSIDFSTTEDELIGKYTLVNGNTVYQKGAVREAMENGGILLLDELDRGNPESLICLNMIMDGYAYTDKKTGELIEPAEGFQIIATANTKMQGDDTDRFVSAKVMDEAFIERFPITIEQSYPSAAIEKRIVGKLTDDADFADKLVRWAQATRKTYEAGAIDNFITTRRLTFIAGKNMLITGGDKLKAVEYGVSRFPAELRDSFLELYKAVDSGAYVEESEETSQESNF